jgi:hypothetical protein
MAENVVGQKGEKVWEASRNTVDKRCSRYEVKAEDSVKYL